MHGSAGIFVGSQLPGNMIVTFAQYAKMGRIRFLGMTHKKAVQPDYCRSAIYSLFIMLYNFSSPDPQRFQISAVDNACLQHTLSSLVALIIFYQFINKIVTKNTLVGKN
jgi:hypothetical protein